jgi:pimeloyl-ACP methyl ester carboxylesterase
VILFESGGSAPLETWDPVLSKVASFAPVLAYDRSGTGQSPWDGKPPTPDHIGQRLQRLLATLKIAPPYVVVGHSWGGALVRYFAGRYPEQIAGVLYIDPLDITVTRADMVALFESFGAGAAEYDAFTTMMARFMASAPAPMRAEDAVLSNLLNADLESRGLPPPPRVPASVIIASRVGVPPQKGLPFDTRAYAKALHEMKLKRLRTWVTNGGTFEVAENAGHIVHVDAPALIIAAIRRLVERHR